MDFMNKLLHYVCNPSYRFNANAKYGLYNSIPDREFLCRLFKYNMGYDLDLDNPITFNEKLQWLKLNDRKPEYTILVDKCAVKDFVGKKIGEEYIIPTLGVWDNFDEIDFDKLPDQFVLKCTHDSGGLVICKDKNTFDLKAAKKRINKSLSTNFFCTSREWPYKNVQPRIIAEEYMEDANTSELRDYKFFCFNGVPKVLYVATDRQTDGQETKFDFFDMEYSHLDIRNGHPNAICQPEKPLQFEKMKELSKALSEGIPNVRVDFYEVNGNVFFGELTFFHMSGIVPFQPESWDIELGAWIELPKAVKESEKR